MSVAIAAYGGYAPDGIRRGDTVVGYALGVYCGLLMLWLMWFGVRKRSYWSNAGPLSGWLSAHFYLGLTLPPIALLHAAFRLGWNVHGLLYALVMLVVATGIVGVVLYRRIPAAMARDRASEKLDGLLARAAEIDARCHQLANTLPDVFSTAVASAIGETTVGGSALAQLRRAPESSATSRALGQIQAHLAESPPGDRQALNELLTKLGEKSALLRHIHEKVRNKALLDIWLIAHVPLAFASMAALVAHVVAVFYM
jgi:hypothetical protein